LYVSLRPGSRFRSVYRTGARGQCGGVVVFQAPGMRTEPEAGFVAGKKVGNAVARNRAKRRLRDAAQRVSLEPATAYVFVATADVLDAPFPTLVEWATRAAHKNRETDLRIESD